MRHSMHAAACVLSRHAVASPAFRRGCSETIMLQPVSYTLPLATGTVCAHVWSTNQSPRATVICVHGINEHGQRLGSFAQELARDGYEIRSFDLHGHGRSSGVRGLLPSIDGMLQDVRQFVHHVSAQHKHAQPIFLLGQSLGAFLCLEALRDDSWYRSAPSTTRGRVNSDANTCTSTNLCHSAPNVPSIHGVVLQAPPVRVPAHVLPHPVVTLALQYAARTWPHARLARFTKGLAYHSEVRDERLAEDTSDPHYYNGRMRLGTGNTVLEAARIMLGEYVNASGTGVSRYAHMQCPMLLQHGDADQLCSVVGSAELARLLPPQLTQFITYPGAHHDLLRERHSVVDAVICDVRAFFARHA